ncbi:unnamed protein product, partial [Rotaria sp. Silwood1]
EQLSKQSVQLTSEELLPNREPVINTTGDSKGSYAILQLDDLPEPDIEIIEQIIKDLPNFARFTEIVGSNGEPMCLNLMTE